jgi:cyclic-di-AMP phosphodiesterase PgpH
MATIAKLGRRERPSQSEFKKFLESVRSRLTWVDLLVGLSAAALMAALLIGFRYQSIPEYKIGDIAGQEIRARSEITYEDSAATAQKKEAARSAVPVVYDLRNDLISGLEKEISHVFSVARDLLARVHAPAKGELPEAMRAEVFGALNNLPKAIPTDVLDVLLRQRFSTSIESEILKVLENVLREGITTDRLQFMKDQRAGITVRDVGTGSERSLPEAYLARDIASAREYLRQFHLEFSALPARDKATIIEYLQAQLIPTLISNQALTFARRTEAAAQVLPVFVQIKPGKAIVRSGEEVTPAIYSQLQALKNLRRPRPLLWQFAGFFGFAALFVYSLWRYLVHYQTRHRNLRNHAVLILAVVICVLLAMRLGTMLADSISQRLAPTLSGDPVSIYYAIPFVFGTLLVTLLVDVNLGTMASLAVATMVGLFYANAGISAYIITGSLAAIFSVRQYKARSSILKAGLTVSAVGAFTLIALDCVDQTPLDFLTALNHVAYALSSGLLTASLSSILLPAFESGFKIVTDIRLLELSNLNAPVLRRLSVEAPGTYHHSLMVATLAEAAAEAIGGNPLLVRVGAYYHDIGKTLKPEYFVENQAFGANKHESLSPSMSCLIIASHVKDGLMLAKEIRLPQRIRDLIPQHHGTRIMTYFFQKAKDAANGKGQEIKDAEFRYPGPKPQSKEAAIIMMADSVEAASRTLTDPSPAQLQGMIDRLVDAVVSDNQFDECDITLRDIALVKESFLKVVTGIFHRRIDYPGYDFRTTESESGKLPVPGSGPRQAKAI